MATDFAQDIPFVTWSQFKQGKYKPGTDFSVIIDIESNGHILRLSKKDTNIIDNSGASFKYEGCVISAPVSISTTLFDYAEKTKKEITIDFVNTTAIDIAKLKHEKGFITYGANVWVFAHAEGDYLNDRALIFKGSIISTNYAELGETVSITIRRADVSYTAIGYYNLLEHLNTRPQPVGSVDYNKESGLYNWTPATGDDGEALSSTTSEDILDPTTNGTVYGDYLGSNLPVGYYTGYSPAADSNIAFTDINYKKKPWIHRVYTATNTDNPPIIIGRPGYIEKVVTPAVSNATSGPATGTPTYELRNAYPSQYVKDECFIKPISVGYFMQRCGVPPYPTGFIYQDMYAIYEVYIISRGHLKTDGIRLRFKSIDGNLTRTDVARFYPVNTMDPVATISAPGEIIPTYMCLYHVNDYAGNPLTILHKYTKTVSDIMDMEKDPLHIDERFDPSTLEFTSVKETEGVIYNAQSNHSPSATSIDGNRYVGAKYSMLKASIYSYPYTYILSNMAYSPIINAYAGFNTYNNLYDLIQKTYSTALGNSGKSIIDYFSINAIKQHAERFKIDYAITDPDLTWKDFTDNILRSFTNITLVDYGGFIAYSYINLNPTADDIKDAYVITEDKDGFYRISDVYEHCLSETEDLSTRFKYLFGRVSNASTKNALTMSITSQYDEDVPNTFTQQSQYSRSLNIATQTNIKKKDPALDLPFQIAGSTSYREVEVPYVWREDVIKDIYEREKTLYAYPVKEITYSAPRHILSLDVGTIVKVTDEDIHLDEAVGIISEINISEDFEKTVTVIIFPTMNGNRLL